MRDKLGNKIVYTLDLMGNRTAENVYDPAGVLAHTQSAVFNSLGQMIQSITANNHTTRYEYDANGNSIATTDPLTNRSIQAFDALNRLISTTDAANGLTRYQYDNKNTLISID